ncbi:hypothetical protein RJ640_021285 [Escallonia rubra]|uniref:PX domain-containing protein n=1 Tax=Escallonia rubra TaxID=112253 RepID=A0AA88SME3_9ASTE|nr:hypothetical protein RJ640_021285 [Escallonia rubra]
MMNLYGQDFSLFGDIGFSDPTIMDSLSRTSPPISPSSSTADEDLPPQKVESNREAAGSPPKHRYDGTSPLPLGMDWSLPPRHWDGRNIIWPHDPHRRWSYCVTIPSWTILPNSRGSDPVAFYRVQIGIQSPEGVTTTRGILRRFSDFLKLYSELKKVFPKKNLAPAPPKRLLRMRSRPLYEECVTNSIIEIIDVMPKMLSFEGCKQLLSQQHSNCSSVVIVAFARELETAVATAVDGIHSSNRCLFTDSHEYVSNMVMAERRCALEDWMETVLSDIDLSRSAPVATFLELEAAARSSFYDSNQIVVDGHSSITSAVLSNQFPSNSDASFIAGSSSVASDYGNDSTYETSELGTPRPGRSNYANLGMENTSFDQELAGSLEAPDKDGLSGNIDSQLMSDFIQGNKVEFSRHRRKENSVIDKDKSNESTFVAVFSHQKEMDLSSVVDDFKLGNHRLSSESVGSDESSVRVTEISNLGAANSHGDNFRELAEGAESTRTMGNLGGSGLQFPSDMLVALPSDERHKLNRVLITIQRRLATAKTDVEDLIARLNQELAVRQYLTTKVRDLEVELETTKQSGKDNLQQAILTERERFTQMQWDLEELRRKCMEMELELKSEKDEKVHLESVKASIIQENEMLLQELDVAREQLAELQKYHEELESKSKSDVKLLVKEVKSLRSSQLELKQDLSRLLKEKLEAERVLQKEKQKWEHANAANVKLLHEYKVLRDRLKECSVNFLIEEEDKLIVDTSSPSDAIDLVTTSDNRIGLLLAEVSESRIGWSFPLALTGAVLVGPEQASAAVVWDNGALTLRGGPVAQLLAQDVENGISAASSNVDGGSARTSDDELRTMLAEVFIDNARLRKQINSVIRCTLSSPDKSDRDDDDDDEEETSSTSSRKTVLSKFLER